MNGKWVNGVPTTGTTRMTVFGELWKGKENQTY